jgi:hypothetical protein
LVTPDRIAELRQIIATFDEQELLDPFGPEHVMKRALWITLDAIERVRNLASKSASEQHCNEAEKMWDGGIQAALRALEGCF